MKTLKQLANKLKIGSNKSIKIEGLDYFYYADVECIVAYCNDEHRYTYTTVEQFLDEHGFDSVDDLDEFL